jgi:hypothetical protein
MRDLLIIKAPVAIKVQAAEKVAKMIAADSANIVDDKMLEKKRQERMKELNELNCMRVEDKKSLIFERFRKERDYQKRREVEERMLEVQISEKSDLEKKDQHDERNRAAQLEMEEQERLRLVEEENILLEEKENRLHLQEEEMEQEHCSSDDLAEQQSQEEREKKVEEIRMQILKEKEMLEAQLEMEDEEAAKGLIGEIEGGEDELVEDESGVEAGEGLLQ